MFTSNPFSLSPPHGAPSSDVLTPDPRRDAVRFRLAAAGGALTAALLVAAAALAVLIGAHRKSKRDMLRAASDLAAYGARLVIEEVTHFGDSTLELLSYATARGNRTVAVAPDSLLARLVSSQRMALADSTYDDSLRAAFVMDPQTQRTRWAVTAGGAAASQEFRETALAQIRATLSRSPAAERLVGITFTWKGEDVTLWVFVQRDSSSNLAVVEGTSYSRSHFVSRLVPHILATVPILPASVSGAQWDLADPRKALALQATQISVRIQDLSTHEVEFDTGPLAYEGAHGEYALTSGSNHGYRVRVGLADSLTDLLVEHAPPEVSEWALWILLSIAVGLAGVAVLIAQRAFESMTQRQRFLAAVSHELRTPLTQVRLSVETLRRLPMDGDERRSRTVQALDRGTEQLTRTVENLLTLAKSELPTWKVRQRATDLEALVRNAVETMAPVAATRRVSFEIVAATSVWGWVDPDAFRHVILNLLDNALKYGPREQCVRIRLRVYSEVAEVSIADHGPGVPAELRERIWNAYERLNGNGTPHRDGLGLGLSVVRDIIARHAGWVRIDDNIDGGAVFVVGVRAADASEAVPSTAEFPVVRG